MVNLTVNLTAPKLFEQYAPDQACFDWCIEQHIVHSNNLEAWGVILAAIAYLFLLLAGWAFEIERLKKYQHLFLYMAKVWMLLFFLVYFVFFRWQVFGWKKLYCVLIL